MPDEIIPGGLTVKDAKTKKFMSLVAEGTDAGEAAKAVGLSLQELRKTGKLAQAARELLARVEEENLLKKDKLEAIAKATALELMLQDDDLKVKLGAAKTVLGGPSVAVQINNNHLRADPEVLESLKTLQLDIEKEEE